MQHMSTFNISLPISLEPFVDEQVRLRGFSSRSDYVYELIRHDQARQLLRNQLLAGVASPPSVPADSAYFDRLRSQVPSAQSSKPRNP